MTRTQLSLDGHWELIPDLDQQLDQTTLDSAGQPRDVIVPGPWQIQFPDLRYRGGTVWYRRSLVAPPSDIHDAVYVLHFGAVDYHATVWLNGSLIGLHEGGYLPFELLCPNIRIDQPNELIVRVVDPSDNSAAFEDYPFDEIPHGKQSWYGPIGGIWQHVYIESRAATYIERLKITPLVADQQAAVEVFLNQPLAQSATLICTLTAPDGTDHEYAFPLDPGESQYALMLLVAAPQLWDIGQPNLYRLDATLVMDDQSQDRLTETFGMRTVGIANGAITLNGRPIYLRGALDQDYYPRGVYTVFSDAELDDQFAKAKHLGLNCLRIHIKITDPRYYAAADRAGLLIWTELPNWQLLTPTTKERARTTLMGMVERDWNHPSIIIWTIINEDWGTELMVNPDHRAWLADTYDFMKILDPTRLVVDNSACHGNFHVVSDLEDFHVYYAVPDHYRSWKSWVDVFANRPDWSYAFEYENVENWRAYNRNPWAPITRKMLPEVRRTKQEPLIVSEFGNWGLPDVDKLFEAYGGSPWWFQTGMEWGSGEVYPHGIERRFRQYYLDKVFGTLSNLSQASQQMQFVAMKYEIEQMRRHASIVGYVITEFTDVNWECNGLLDLCRNPKAYHDIFHQVNGDDVIVPLCERTALWEGETCHVELLLSHYSTLDLTNSTLDWSTDALPDAHGTFAGIGDQGAGVRSLGTVTFTIPSLSESARVRLHLRLHDAAGQLVAENHQDLYVFPGRLSQAPEHSPLLYSTDERLTAHLRGVGYNVTDDHAAAAAIVTTTMTDDLRWYLQEGGRVLWLAESEASQQTHLGSLRIQQRQGSRWQGDWASNFNWLRQDTLFGAIPTGGVLDFAFVDLIPDHVILGLAPRDYAEDVHAGLAVGWLHHTVGLVAERRVGLGRLLISTFNLRDHLATQPVAGVMLRDLVSHVVR